MLMLSPRLRFFRHYAELSPLISPLRCLAYLPKIYADVDAS